MAVSLLPLLLASALAPSLAPAEPPAPRVALGAAAVASAGTAAGSPPEAADARAAAPQAAEPEAAPPEAAAAEVVPPRPLGSIEVPYPADAPPLDRPVEVEVLLRIDARGNVEAVELLRGAGTPWDETVLERARRFRFHPARWRGEPAPVEIPFVQRFEPPTPTRQEERRAEAVQADASLLGELVEMGTREQIPAAMVTAQVDGQTFQVEADHEGRFDLPLASGDARVEVDVAGYRRFVVTEKLAAGQQLQVRYLLERLSYDPYSRVVIGKERRDEVSRTTLRDREIRRVPGTFGDPFRVVSTMPGVSQVVSLLDYPIVRGASPGSTGILLDGTRIPQLFHYLAGPAVIHPAFLESVDFYPGSFPIQYGGYTGGIVDGITRSPLRDERRLELGLDLLNASAFVQQPLGDTTAMVAGRYGYPAMLLSAFSPDGYASYWDYQGRFDGRLGDGRWTAFAFGSMDEVGSTEGGEEQVALRSLFHRLALRWQSGSPGSFDRYELTLGLDRILTGANAEDEGGGDPTAPIASSADTGLQTWTVHPRASWRRPITDSLALHTGLDLQWKRSEQTFHLVSDDAEEAEDADRLVPPSWLLQAGAFAEFPWWVTEDLLVTPGMRLDLWQASEVSRGSVDPRLNWRWRFSESERSTLWLKGGIGIFHQPPRPPVPLPGLEVTLLREGLPAAVQSTLGTELELTSGYVVDLQTYFNYMKPVFLDLSLGRIEEGYDPSSPLTGRSYGAELLLRKRDVGPLFGWISYTLSRSERLSGDGWKPFDFDRSHMLQLVAGLRLPRDWEIGLRFQAISGRPLNAWDEQLQRAAPFTRLDLRIDKRVAYRSWMLDFYVEVINTMISREQLADSAGAELPYIFPTIGIQAVL